ncbi:CHAT domain-containing protein [Streptomyces ipomoeae]|uniref:CHAT domain-containing protein n=1 Tax=Streptomyces ipomoeae TaxID=103232 RepID=UPI0011463E38|nr:CHAT domain-containing protein [Streptomyces ipomoeae]TQE34140.1 CHAT domain-containing protein [Streptomyces ipomoeae]
MSGSDDAARMAARAMELYARWGAVRDPRALDEAIALLRRCRDLLPEGHPARPMALSNLCCALRDRYAVVSRDEAELDEAVDSGRRAVASAPPGDPNRWMYHGNLAGALNALVQTRQSSADTVLDEAVARAAEAARSAPQPVAVFQSHLGVALTARAARGGDGADSDVRAAVDAFRAAVSATDPRDPQLAMYLTHLGVALHQRVLRTTDPRGRADGLQEALDHTRRAARLCSPRDPEYVLYLANLAAVIATQAELAQETADFDALVDMERRDLAAVPAEWRARRTWLLVAALRLRYDRTRDARDIDEAVTLCQETLASGEDAVAGPYLHELGSAYLARFRQSRDPADGDAAVDFAQRAVSSAAGPQRERAEALLGEARAVRYRLAPGGSGDGAGSGGGSGGSGGSVGADPHGDGDGDEAIAALEAARRRSPAGSAELALCLSELGLTHMTRAIRLRHAGLDDPSGALDRAAAVLREAAELRVLEGAQALPVLFNLGRVLGLLYERSGDPALLDEAVRRLEEAVAAVPPGHPESAKVLSALGMALRNRADRLDSVPDLHRAVDLTQQAVEAVPPGHPERGQWLSHLGAALTTRYLRLNTVADLEDAVRVGREAVAAVPPGTPPHDRAVLLTNLGMTLRRMYERSGAFADLDESVEALRAAVEAAAPGSEGVGEAAVTLCLALSDRYERTHDTHELDEAIDAGRLAVQAYPRGHARRVMALTNLAVVLIDRGRQQGRRGDVDEALRCCQEVVRATPDGHPARGRSLLGLSTAFLTRYELTRSAAAVGEAIDAAESALRATPDDDVRRVSFLTALAQAHTFAALHAGSDRDMRKACAVFREAAGVEGVPTKVRFSAAAHWGLRAALLEDWAQAVDGYRLAIAQLPLMAWHGLELEDRISGLAVSDSIACDAAAAALSAGRPETALQLLEQGRGVLLAQAVDSRFDLTALEEQEPRLAHRIAEIRSVLHSADSAFVDPTAPAREQWAEARERRELSAELDELTRDAYRLLGLGDFLGPPSPEELRAAAGEGTVVVVNTSFLRCDALIVARDTLRTVPLPDLRLEGPGGLQERTEALLAALSSASRSPQEAGRVLRDTLEWLRETIVAPVLTASASTGQGSGRLWWCPTGLLALLPLHAAGELPERYVCSYATTLRSLARARRRQNDGDRTAGGVLVVDQADVPGLLPLPSARKEALRLVTQVRERKLLAGPMADRRAVRRALPNHSCLHFAGHARHDPARPARSGLFCHGDQRPALLTVEDIARLRLDAAELAFLSACETARGTARLPDEALHLAGALQLAGFTHVVAAQWVAEDTTAQQLTATFYAELRHPDAPDRLDPARSASALHTAVRRIRRQNPDPLLWAAYVHTGP